MPSKSRAQHTLMTACAHGAKLDKCPPAKVAKEYAEADKKVNVKKLPAKKKP